MYPIFTFVCVPLFEYVHLYACTQRPGEGMGSSVTVAIADVSGLFWGLEEEYSS